MLGIPSFAASALSGFFTFIGLAVTVMAVVYVIYRYFQNRNQQRQESSFADIENQRQVMVETVRDYAADSTVDLQQQASEILNGIQRGQEHFQNLMREFDRDIETIRESQTHLTAANDDLQSTIISPFQTLLGKMKIKFQAISEQIHSLVAAYTKGIQALVEREKELSAIVTELKRADRSLDTIGHIRQSILTKDKKISSLQEQNTQLTEKITALLKKATQYEQAIQKQKEIIELLKQQSHQTQHSV